MLVLSRKIGEVITIGNSIEITILSYDRGVVRLGINAPKNVPVHRKEIHDKIIELNKQAARTEVQAIKAAMNKTKQFLNKDDDNKNLPLLTFTKKD